MSKNLLFTVLTFSYLGVFCQNARTFFIPFRENKSGVLEVDVKINGYPSSFIFDPGATMVSFGKLFYDSLVKQSFISAADSKYRTKTKMANGSLTDVTVINLKLLLLGDVQLTNVEAMVADAADAPPLIGQNVMQRFSVVSIDNSNRQIILKQIDDLTQVRLGEIRFIPCNSQVVGELERIKNVMKADSMIIANSITQEQSIPPSKALSYISAKITIRYFDSNDLDEATGLYNRMIKQGYSASDIIKEDMTPYYTSTIPGYIEIWIK